MSGVRGRSLFASIRAARETAQPIRTAQCSLRNASPRFHARGSRVTAAGRSPGDLDLIFFAEAQAGVGD